MVDAGKRGLSRWNKPMKRAIRARLTYANVVATIALFLALGLGTVYAANKINGKQIKKNSVPGNRLKKNSVPGNRLKKNSVPGNRLKKNSVPGNRLKDNSVTGQKVNEATLGTVPTATNLAPPEGWHEVGAPGEPGFQNGSHNLGGSTETVAFYKDREGVVHLKGFVTGAAFNTTIFQLPAGYRPASGKIVLFPAICSDCQQPFTVTGGATGTIRPTTEGIAVIGPSLSPGDDGAVQPVQESGVETGSIFGLDGITFRAGS